MFLLPLFQTLLLKYSCTLISDGQNIVPEYLLVMIHGYQEFLIFFISPVITALIWVPLKLVGQMQTLSTVYYCMLNWNSLKEFLIWIKNMNTIKFLDQGVTFPVESTCIPTDILHNRSEERRGLWRPCELGLCPLALCSACHDVLVSWV